MVVVVGAMLGSLPSLQATELFDGMVGYWPLDEGDGDFAIDLFGDEEDAGMLRNGPLWLDEGSALLGNSALFFGGMDAAQDVLIPNSSDLNFTTNAASVSAWVSTLKLPSELPDQFGGIYDSSQDGYIMYLDRDNQELRVKFTDSDGTAERPGVPESMLTISAWHHVLGVYNGDEKFAKIYFDGQLVDTHMNAGFGQPVVSGQIASIGANPSGAAGNESFWFFEGAIDDVAVWNRPLGQAEATYLFNNGTGTAIGAANPDIAFVPDGGGTFGSCDYDTDGSCDIEDIDSLVAEIAAGTNDALFDLSGDGVVDDTDLTQWLRDGATHDGFGEAYLLGDSNLDGSVNSTDLNNLALNWQQHVALWSGGDFKVDGVVDSADLNELALNWRQSIPMASVVNAPVPEPSALLLAVVGSTLVWRRSRRS